MWNILPNTVVTVSTNSLMLFYLNKSNSGNDMIWFLIIVFLEPPHTKAACPVCSSVGSD